jgi:hypothetical protein
MIFVALNALFAWLFFTYARANIPKGIQFIKVGWLALQVNAPKAKTNGENVFVRYAVSEGGQFFLGGLFSLITGIFAAALCVVFAVLAVWMGMGQ